MKQAAPAKSFMILSRITLNRQAETLLWRGDFLFFLNIFQPQWTVTVLFYKILYSGGLPGLTNLQNLTWPGQGADSYSI